ncbi:MAG TPA: methyltransferase domain-containing protein [Thermoleophilaceae bacterium]|jgi:SAM-dependent methyltransferase|nr:methyltransferase domain-containing protein [Thermoleophilaceae bacterium]
MAVDPRAASGFAGTADAYELGRPSYPADALEEIARLVPLGTGSAVLDLAAGTGKLTRLLVPLVGRVVAVDPSESMLAKLRDQVPGVDARLGTAERIPLRGGEVEAVFVAEAFHWFRVEEATPEIARVLAPGGVLVVMSNRGSWSRDDLPWLDEFRDLVEPHRIASGEFPAGGDGWKELLAASGRFSELSSSSYDYVHEVAPEAFVAQVASWSWIANLADEARRALLERVHELVAAQTRVTLRYVTEVHWARRL